MVLSDIVRTNVVSADERESERIIVTESQRKLFCYIVFIFIIFFAVHRNPNRSESISLEKRCPVHNNIKIRFVQNVHDYTVRFDSILNFVLPLD